MSEKQSEYFLRNILNSCNLKQNIHYFNSPNENKTLKELFKNSSKNNTNFNGFPDCIYFFNNTIIIFECKSEKLNKAIEDVKYYYNSISNKLNYTYFLCGFVNETIYKILDSNFNEIQKNLHEFLCNLNNIFTFDSVLMNKQIHSIHNYIRDNTKISNEDKSLFIGGILVALKNNEFKHLIKNIHKNDISVSLLRELDKHKLDLQYIYNSLNNEHLLNICKNVNLIYEENPNNDLLNYFYSEFVKYQNTDSKSLGIVLTPDYIVKLMIELLQLNENDIFIDLCSGTGSFPIEALKYNPKKVIACEYQKKLYELLKINSILRNNKIECINNDCFLEKFQKCTKSAINPPYGMKDKNELEFIIKQLEIIEENGLITAIIPIGCLSDNKKNEKYKKELLKIGNIKCIINLNKDIFYPTANVKCCIIMIQKTQIKTETIMLNYEEDETEIIKHTGKIKKKEFEKKYKKLIEQYYKKECYFYLKETDEWNFYTYNKKIEYKINMKELQLKKLENEYINNKLRLLKETDDIYININKSINIKDIIDINKSTTLLLKNCSKDFSKENSIPVISSSKFNNGITNYCNTYTQENSFTINKNGSIGYCFYHSYKYNYTNDVISFKLKKNVNIKNYDIFAYILTQNFIHNGYDFSFKLNIKRFLESKIIIDDNILNTLY